MIVVDSSALVDATTGDPSTASAVRAVLARDPEWVAPEHVRLEAFAAVRGLERGGKVDPADALAAVEAIATAQLHRVDTAALRGRIWQLRANATPYDAAYVAAAEELACALVTTDRKFARIPGVHCEIHLALPE